MNNKERALKLIRERPGIDAREIMRILNVKRGHSLKLRELEKERKIQFDKDLDGCCPLYSLTPEGLKQASRDLEKSDPPKRLPQWDRRRKRR